MPCEPEKQDRFERADHNPLPYADPRLACARETRVGRLSCSACRKARTPAQGHLETGRSLGRYSKSAFNTIALAAMSSRDGIAPSVGGEMVGSQYAGLKTQLGPLPKGVVSYEAYDPELALIFCTSRTSWPNTRRGRQQKTSIVGMNTFQPRMLHANWSSSALASFRAGVSKPSVNQP